MKNRGWFIIIAAVVAMILGIGATYATLKQGDRFSAYALMGLDGKTKTPKDFKGKVVIYDVWATWCGPCRMEIPELIQLQTEYKKKGVEVVGIATDREGADKVKPFAKEYKINYAIVLDPKSEFAGPKLQVRGIPTLFIVDKKGVVRFVHVGFTQKSVLEKELKQVLED